jgi:MOSC domain-containing protein
VSGAAVAWLTVAPVKGLALRRVEEIELEVTGARGDRLFHLIDADGRLVNRKQAPTLAGIQAESDDGEQLVLRFPDGEEVAGPVVAGEEVATSFYGRLVEGRLVEGPFSDALSSRMRRPVRLVRVAPGEAHDRGPGGAVSLLSTGSLAELARAAATAEDVDPRRFRMLIGIEGIDPHEEDGWLGRLVDVGSATVRPVAHCGRCAVTTQDPDTGAVTLDTLRVLGEYRGAVASLEPLPFGVWGEVVTAGRVRLGDPVRAR